MATTNTYGETLTREDRIPAGWKIGIGGYEHTDAEGYDWYWAVIDGDNVGALRDGVTVSGSNAPAAPATKPEKPLWPWLAGGGALLLIIILIFIFRKK